jgi:tryptophan synthase alpha chain
MEGKTMHIPVSKPYFIPFITAGDPHPEATIELALALQAEGAAVLELGVPYSDPLADGPVIQRASSRALKQGMTLSRTLELVGTMRKRGVHLPIVLFTYYNPILAFGEERFANVAKQVGANGVLVPDLPYEEGAAFRNICRNHGLAYISLVAPTSQSRIEKIANEAEGFLYCISSLGVTGTRDTFSKELKSFVDTAKKYSPVPVVVGFGVSKQEQIAHLLTFSDGIVIGSALIRRMEELHDLLYEPATRPEAVHQFRQFVRELIAPILAMDTFNR